MRARVAVAGLMGVIVMLVAVLLTGPAAAAPTDPCAGGATPTVSFAGGATTMTVPAGAASTIPPTVQVDCAGTPAPAGTTVSVTLNAVSSDVSFLSGSPSSATTVVYYPSGSTMTGSTNANGQITLPIVTSLSNTAGGTFSITVSAGTATATLSGQITGGTTGILPPTNPSTNENNSGTYCSSPSSAACINNSVAQVNEGRYAEGLGPLELPSNWSSLSVDDQLFVLVNLERTARGLVPITGLASDWNTEAQNGAQAGEDPSQAGSWTAAYASTALSDNNGDVLSGSNDYFTGSDWAGYPNDIQAMAGWMYDDGPGGSNGDCTTSNSSGCWGHRDSIIESASQAAKNGDETSACQVQCVMGTGYAATDSSGSGPSFTLIFGPGNNGDPVSFSWASEVPDLPACEQTGDSCSFAGQPIETSGGTFTTATTPTTTPTSTTQTVTQTTTSPTTGTATTSTTSTPTGGGTGYKVSFGNQKITFTVGATVSVCVANTFRLPITFTTTKLAGSKKTKLTFASVKIYLDKGIKHTRRVTVRTKVDGRVHIKVVTSTTYTPNAASTRDSSAFKLSLTALAKGRHTVRAVITYEDKVTYSIKSPTGKTLRTSKLFPVTKTLTSPFVTCGAI